MKVLDTVAIEELLRCVARIQLWLFIRDAIGRKSLLESFPDTCRKLYALTHALQELDQRITLYEALGALELDDVRDSLENFNCVLYLQSWWLLKYVAPIFILRIDVCNQAELRCR